MFIGEEGRKAYHNANKQHNVGRPYMYSMDDYGHGHGDGIEGGGAGIEGGGEGIEGARGSSEE